MPKFFKKRVDIHIKEITTITNDYIKKGILSDELKLVDVSTIFKKEDTTKKIIDRSEYYHTCQKSLKRSFICKLIL